MKLGDGRKLKMHVSPPCEERARLSEECSRALAEWLDCKDHATMSKSDTSHGDKIKAMKRAQGRLRAAQDRLSSHVRSHGC
jgi:hypothetical protein